MTRHLTITAVAALTLLTACSDDSGKGLQDVLNGSATTQASTQDGGTLPGDGICNLLTTEEVSAALGKPMADGVESHQGDIPVCTWTSTLPPTNDSLEGSVTLTLAVLPLTATDRATFDQLVADPEHTKVLDGLGDEAIAKCAFSSTDGCPWYDTVYVIKGDQYLEVDLGNFSSPDDFDQDQIVEVVTAVATVAAPRL